MYEPRNKPMQPKEQTLASHFVLFILSSNHHLTILLLSPNAPSTLETLYIPSHILHVPQCNPYPSSIPTYLSHHIDHYCSMYSGMLPPWAKDP